MSRKTILVSDLTGEDIDDKSAVRILINFGDAKKGTVVLDVNESEIGELISKGTRQGRKGPKPKA